MTWIPPIGQPGGYTPVKKMIITKAEKQTENVNYKIISLGELGHWNRSGS